MRTLREVFIEDFAGDPEEAVGFLKAVMEEYQRFGNIATVLSALELVVASQGGVAKLAQQTQLGDTPMRQMRKWREVLIERLAKDREEAIGYLQLSVEEYQNDGDTRLFLMSLQTFVASQGGVAKLAKQTQLEPAALAQLLSGNEAPSLDTFALILKVLGCRLTIAPLAEAMPAVAVAPETEEVHVENVA